MSDFRFRVANEYFEPPTRPRVVVRIVVLILGQPISRYYGSDEDAADALSELNANTGRTLVSVDRYENTAAT